MGPRATLPERRYRQAAGLDQRRHATAVDAEWAGTLLRINGRVDARPVKTGATFERGTPEKAFDRSPYLVRPRGGQPGRMYDVSADRKRFLMIKETSVADERPLYLPIRPGTCSDRDSVRVLLQALRLESEQLDQACVSSVGPERFETRLRRQIDPRGVCVDGRLLECRICVIEVAEAGRARAQGSRRRELAVSGPDRRARDIGTPSRPRPPGPLRRACRGRSESGRTQWPSSLPR